MHTCQGCNGQCTLVPVGQTNTHTISHAQGYCSGYCPQHQASAIHGSPSYPRILIKTLAHSPASPRLKGLASRPASTAMVSMKRFGCALVETMLALHLPRRPFTAGRHLRHLGVEIRRLGAPASAACNSDNSGVCQGRAEHVRHPQAGQHAERRRSGRKHPPKTTFPSILTYPERAFASRPGDPGSLNAPKFAHRHDRRVFPLIAIVRAHMLWYAIS